MLLTAKKTDWNQFRSNHTASKASDSWEDWSHHREIKNTSKVGRREISMQHTQVGIQSKAISRSATSGMIHTLSIPKCRALEREHSMSLVPLPWVPLPRVPLPGQPWPLLLAGSSAGATGPLSVAMEGRLACRKALTRSIYTNTKEHKCARKIEESPEMGDAKLCDREYDKMT